MRLFNEEGFHELKSTRTGVSRMPKADGLSSATKKSSALRFSETDLGKRKELLVAFFTRMIRLRNMPKRLRKHQATCIYVAFYDSLCMPLATKLIIRFGVEDGRIDQCICVALGMLCPPPRFSAPSDPVPSHHCCPLPERPSTPRSSHAGLGT